MEGEVGLGEPDCRAFELAVRALDCEPAKCMTVGDDLEGDIRAPKALGMRTVCLDASACGAPRHGEADYVIASITELPGLWSRWPASVRPYGAGSACSE